MILQRANSCFLQRKHWIGELSSVLYKDCSKDCSIQRLELFRSDMRVTVFHAFHGYSPAAFEVGEASNLDNVPICVVAGSGSFAWNCSKVCYRTRSKGGAETFGWNVRKEVPTYT